MFILLSLSGHISMGIFHIQQQSLKICSCMEDTEVGILPEVRSRVAFMLSWPWKGDAASAEGRVRVMSNWQSDRCNSAKVQTLDPWPQTRGVAKRRPQALFLLHEVGLPTRTFQVEEGRWSLLWGVLTGTRNKTVRDRKHKGGMFGRSNILWVCFPCWAGLRWDHPVLSLMSAPCELRTPRVV